MEFMGYDVVRANHVGDWGTQFGMLIAYMREAYPDYETNMPDIKDLDGYYKQARMHQSLEDDLFGVTGILQDRLPKTQHHHLRIWRKFLQPVHSKDHLRIVG